MLRAADLAYKAMFGINAIIATVFLSMINRQISGLWVTGLIILLSLISLGLFWLSLCLIKKAYPLAT